MFKSVQPSNKIVEEEQKTLNFWKEEKVFENSLKIRDGRSLYVFYEGPPTANGKPGIHHGLSRIFKDTVLRYKSATGFYVPRKGGWDTQGLPVELEVEKELKISGKPDIERYGVENFIKKCKESVFTYKAEWEKMTERIAFWLDMDSAYVTYANSYIESIWWILKELFNKGLLYEGYKVTPYCPRCGTTLSMHEVAQGYKKVMDPSIFVKFKIKDKFKDAYFLVWTTTPWTLPSNVALAINSQFEYAHIELKGERFILANTLLHQVFKDDYHDQTFKVIETFEGKELLGIKYEPMFDFAKLKEDEKERGFKIIEGDFVSLEDGTGIVHVAPAYGEDDLRMGNLYNLPFVHLVDLEGKFKVEVEPWKGLFVKTADKEIINYLKENNVLYRQEKYEHTYPFCWRCDTPLLYYAKNSWFVRMTSLKDELIKNNDMVNWYPDHIKRGRFGNWLENINDWALSRERFWGTPLNLWKCETCGNIEAIGSIEELKEKATLKFDEIELHKPYVDNILIKCSKCEGISKRVPEVIDVWFDSGAMPYAQWHYPFENQEIFKKNFPADFITEGVDQTRGWFYSLHAISTALYNNLAYKNVMCLELILDEKGQKMSKHIGNVIDPWLILNNQGADALRWSLYTSSPPWFPRRFGVNVVNDALKNFLIPLRNVYSFFVLYANIDKINPVEIEIPFERRNLLDKWIISKFNLLIKNTKEKMEVFDINPVAKDIEKFVDDLSNWYVRRSRRRFWKSENDEDKYSAYKTLYEVLTGLARLLTPFTPFFSEELYQNLVRSISKDAPISVHYLDYPQVIKSEIDETLVEEMDLVVNITSLGRAARKKSSIKVRQPLSKAIIYLKDKEKEDVIKRYKDIILEELNVKGIDFIEDPNIVATFSVKPNFPLLGKRLGSLLPLLQEYLTETKEAVVENLRNNGFVNVYLNDEEYTLTSDELILEIKEKEDVSVAADKDSLVAIDTHIDEELKKEWILRETLHFVQNLRKESNFEVQDRIIASFSIKNPWVIEIIKTNEDFVKKEILAEQILFNEELEMAAKDILDIDSESILIMIKRV